MGRDPSTIGTEWREGGASSHCFCLLQPQCLLLMGKHCQAQCKPGETHLKGALRRPEAAAQERVGTRVGRGGSSAGAEGNQGTDATTLGKGRSHSGSRYQQQVPSCRRARAHPWAHKKREMPHRVRPAVAPSHVPWAKSKHRQQLPRGRSTGCSLQSAEGRSHSHSQPEDLLMRRTPLPWCWHSPRQQPLAQTHALKGPRARQKPWGDNSKGLWL